MLEPGHVVPRDLGGPCGFRRPTRIEVGDAGAPGQCTEEGVERKRPATAEQVGVVEIHVDECGKRAPRERATEIPERVRRR